ncbi:hypothetical protein VHA_001649 [Grimontia hollisae CIP 101886]|uniref:Uncharacterized protein n=1 Tax=Grimontia hollisae CIP 101886 TaxID=675812 RepID=D0I7C7_GRIHO|nr:hypothetical protein VHA_001649 [Grimontia hollisae CIP 101886]
MIPLYYVGSKTHMMQVLLIIQFGRASAHFAKLKRLITLISRMFASNGD